MSRAASSIKFFAVYLFLLGPILAAAPNLLLSLLGIPPTSEVWIRVVGVLVFVLGVYSLVAARHELRPFFRASVVMRLFVFAAFSFFAIFGLGSPAIAVFGVIDLLGSIWTWFALRADAQSGGAAMKAKSRRPFLGPTAS
jgi:hypothetical protein